MSESNSLNHFDRTLSALHGLPDIVSTKPTMLRVIPTFGIGTHLYSVETYRQRDRGDTVFLQYVAEDQTVRLVIPPSVVDAIVRQRDQLTTKSRKRAGRAVAQTLKARGIKPGFMKKKA